MIEGNLEEIDKYTAEQNSHYYDTSHCNVLYEFKEDHNDYFCGMCSLVGVDQDYHFENLARFARNRIEWANRPILIDGKVI